MTKSATCCLLLTRHTLSLLDLTSFYNHKCASSLCVMRPRPCLWKKCSVSFCLDHQHNLHLCIRDHTSPTRCASILMFQSAAAYISASALLLAMDPLLSCVQTCHCQAVSHPDMKMFAILGRQSKFESKVWCHFCAHLPEAQTCLQCLSPFEYLQPQPALLCGVLTFADKLRSLCKARQPILTKGQAPGNVGPVFVEVFLLQRVKVCT